MKNNFLLLIAAAAILMLGKPYSGFSQIENLIVETYYISDSLDATDSTQGRTIEPGSVTYRIYLDLAQGSKLRKIYGDANHALKIRSTQNFYNNIDRPNAYLGYLINRNWFSSNPTLGLDSWLTLGVGCRLGSTNFYGVPKTMDTDGSFIGGTNNQGGTGNIPGGILVNNNPEAGLPLTVADGYTPLTASLGQWFDYGFYDASLGHDTTVFGSLYTGNEFYSRSAVLQQNNGVTGATPENLVLVAQLTTKGEIAFELNVQIEEADGTVVHYVADDSVLINTTVPLYIEKLSPFLKYPPVCGCRNPDYLEYSTRFACDNNDSCKTLIVFGCMDPKACNYNAAANFNIAELCCYPGYCADRDIEIVCPSLKNARLAVFPNPADEFIQWHIENAPGEEAVFTVFNSTGKTIMSGKAEDASVSSYLDIGGLREGIYLIQAITASQRIFNKTFFVTR